MPLPRDCRLLLAPDYDERNGVTLGDNPYSSGADLVATVRYDSTAFGEAEEYSSNPNTYAACNGKGARSGWFRFTTAVTGRLFLSVDSSANGYDVISSIYTAPAEITPGSASIGQLKQVTCANANHGTPNESYTFGDMVQGGNVVYIQTLSVCADREEQRPCDAAERSAARGGLTTINIRFDPDDAPDEDGVPNPLSRRGAESWSAPFSATVR